MFKRLDELNFVIGLFFCIISLVLLIGAWVDPALAGRINIYTGIAFLVFSLAMMFLRTNDKNAEKEKM